MKKSYTLWLMLALLFFNAANAQTRKADVIKPKIITEKQEEINLRNQDSQASLNSLKKTEIIERSEEKASSDCPTPENSMVTDVTSSSAILNWDEVGSAASWQVSFSDYNQEQVTSTMHTVSAESLSVDGLIALGDYSFTVRAVCADGDTSLWAPEYAFNTLSDCDVVSDINESFEISVPPICWINRAYGSGSMVWEQSSTKAVEGSYSAKAAWENTGGENQKWLITSNVTIPANQSLKFYATDDFSSNYGSYIKVLISNNINPLDTSAYSILLVVNESDVVNDIFSEFTVDVSAYSGQNVFIAFVMVDNNGDSWYLDNISFESCAAPSNIALVDVSTTTAMVSWSGFSDRYSVEYGPSGFALGTGISMEIDTESVLLSGLEAGSSYDFYVQSLCSSSEESEWVGPMAFNTLCETIRDLSESFETSVPPMCWSNFANGTGSIVWSQSSTLVASGQYAAKASFESSNGENEKWLVTPKLTIPFGRPLSFSTTDEYAGDFGSYLNVMVSTDSDPSNTSAYTSLLIIQESDVVYGEMESFSVDLSNYEGQDAYIAFVMIDNNGDSWYLDDVAFVSCGIPENLAAQNVNQTSFDVVWESPANTFAIEYGMTGFTLGEGVADITNIVEYSVNDLVANTSYDFYVKAICSEGEESEWAGPFSVTTLKTPPLPITTFPYFQGFEEQVALDQWTAMYNTATDGGLNGANLVTPPTSNAWDIITPESFNGNGTSYIYEGTRAVGLAYNAPAFNWLISPDIEVPADGLNLEFMLWLKDSVEVNWVTIFHVMAFDGNGWNSLLTFDENAVSNLYDELVQVNLSAYAGTSMQLAFVYEYNNGYELAIDNIELLVPEPPSSASEILSFSFEEQTGAAAIDSINATVMVEVAEGTLLSELVATFTVSEAASASIDDVVQESGVSVNDFTDPVVYSVLAEDGTTKDWTITVTVEEVLSSAAEMLSFSFEEQNVEGMIDAENASIAVSLMAGTEVTELVATFTVSEAASASIDDVAQQSGISANDFSDPVVYTVIAEDGTTKDWTVTVSVEQVLSSAADVISFSFEEQNAEGIIDTENASIAVTLMAGTEVTELVATFTLSEAASASIDDVVQESGVSVNDFTDPVVYTVLAEDGTTKDWTVTVTVEEELSSAAEILSFAFFAEGPAAEIDSENATISIEVFEGTNVSALQAVFTLSEGAIAKIGEVVQESGVSINDFSDNVVYTIVAEDGTTKNWTISVTVRVDANQAFAELFTVYPNPTTGSVWVSGTCNSNASAKVFDISGKVVLAKPLLSAKEELDLSAMDGGLYFVEISAGDELVILKIIKD